MDLAISFRKQFMPKGNLHSSHGHPVDLLERCRLILPRTLNGTLYIRCCSWSGSGCDQLLHTIPSTHTIMVSYRWRNLDKVYVGIFVKKLLFNCYFVIFKLKLVSNEKYKSLSNTIFFWNFLYFFCECYFFRFDKTNSFFH